ncbi:hypothetical protein [Flavobacterium gyeonganense]|uniref:Uncharacterized protein n=1 Tax=Flavobacterium gyeonganense TaxID=1310418 RepID=A0ABV5HFB6_9FLAO|nr:hypothetical protein [Flavobacterium gyeonganense]
MKKIRLYAALINTILITSICIAQNSFKTIQKDFYKLSGTWEGSLTYLDYSSGKPYTMPANIEIKRIGKSEKFVFSNIYPNETSANSIDTISISPDGKYIEKELVKSKRKLPDGNIEIITENFGNDGNDNKPATIRHTYTLGPTIYKNRKDVQFAGETEWINRHEYSYKKKSSN